VDGDKSRSVADFVSLLKERVAEWKKIVDKDAVDHLLAEEQARALPPSYGP
jgi:hypothetical protein